MLLFDGAIEIDLKDGWIDCSTFRQIPDNQYVWVEKVDQGPEKSIILELLDIKSEWNAE